MGRARGFPLAAFLTVAGILLASFLLLPAGGFWINDNAAKFIQMRALIDSGYRDFSITLPGRGIDQDLDYNPLPPPYFHVEGNKLHSQYSLTFALLSSLPYRILGHRGLLLVPLLSTLLMLAGCARLADLLGGDRRTVGLVVVLIGLATPVWFYSVTFWEHSPAACLVVWGLWHLLRAASGRDSQRAFGGGLLMALAVAFRDELYLFWPIAVGAAIVRAREGRARLAFAALAGGAAGIAPLWGLQRAALGSTLGFHLKGSLPFEDLARQLSARPGVFYDLFMAAGSSPALSAALTAPFLVAVVCGRTVGRWNRALPLLVALAAVSGAVFLGGFLWEPAGIMPWLMASNSLWPAAPVVVLAFLGGRDAGGGRLPRILLVKVALVYALAYGVLTPEWRTQGLHWGNRLLFLLYPLLGIPASMNFVAAWRATGAGLISRRAALAAVAAVSLVAQIYSLTLLRERMLVSGRIDSAVRADAGAAIVTDLWWIPQEISSVTLERPVFLVDSPGALPELFNRICRRGLGRCLLVTRSGPGAATGLARRVGDARFNFFAVDLLSVDACGWPSAP